MAWGENYPLIRSVWVKYTKCKKVYDVWDIFRSLFKCLRLRNVTLTMGVTLFTLEFFMQTQLYITEISGSGDF